MADKFEQLEQQLELFIEHSRQLGIMVADFQPQSQEVLNKKLNNMITVMKDLDRMRGSVQDVQVPVDVFEYIDQGRNPQLYTKECMEKSKAKNEEVRGKIEALNKLRGHLMVELNKTFPHELNKYRAMREERQ
ncbi:DgyrCDS12497 [Dimorphilus gyrociliatus]|uniref:Mediator of RNA polymerase II transcription subunit 10 n=1 Tax=Dimorphilus gyrociliatus TaxID=2664684 RepID=A0A7I8W7R7_9ANNE|nr:DgyrCDS12497 [Dimorphilus gyrociliatus]